MLSVLKLRLMNLRNDIGVIVLMTAMALGLTFIMGGAVGSGYVPTVMIVDEDSSEYSKMLIEEVKGKSGYNYVIGEYKKAVEIVNEGKAITSVVIKEGFRDSIKNGKSPTIGIIKVKDSTELYNLQSIISSIAGKMIGNIKIADITADYLSKFDPQLNKEQFFKDAYNKAVDMWKYRKPVKVYSSILNSTSQTKYDNLKHMAIGFSLFFSMYTIVFSIGTILNDRKYNTWNRMLMSPLSKTSILGGSFISAYIIGVFQLGILILGSKYLFGIDWGQSIGGILTIAAAFVFAVTSLGLMLSGVVKTHAQLGAVTPIVLTSTAMLGGCMWPLEIINSRILLFLANLTPQKWAIQGMEKIAMYGMGYDVAIMPSLILFGMGIIFFTVGVRLVKFE